MARHFAELNSDNKVIRVIVVADDITGSLQSTESETYMESNFSHNEGGVSWKETSKTAAFRNIYAGNNCSYLPSDDVFIPQKTAPSWTLDSNYVWQAPVTYPNVLTYGDDDEPYYIAWDETNQKFIAYERGDTALTTEYEWDAVNLSWSATGNTGWNNNYIPC